MVSLATAREQFGMGDRVNALALVLTSDDAIAAVRESLGRVLPEGHVIRNAPDVRAELGAITGRGQVSVQATFVDPGQPQPVSCATTTAPCTQNVLAMTTLTLTATPDTSTFSHWTGCDTIAGAQCTLTMNGPRTVGVVFNNRAPRPPVARITRGTTGVVHATGPQTIRACTHLDVSSAQIERTADLIRKVLRKRTAVVAAT